MYITSFVFRGHFAQPMMLCVTGQANNRQIIWRVPVVGVVEFVQANIVMNYPPLNCRQVALAPFTHTACPFKNGQAGHFIVRSCIVGRCIFTSIFHVVFAANRRKKCIFATLRTEGPTILIDSPLGKLELFITIFADQSHSEGGLVLSSLTSAEGASL